MYFYTCRSDDPANLKGLLRSRVQSLMGAKMAATRRWEQSPGITPDTRIYVVYWDGNPTSVKQIKAVKRLETLGTSSLIWSRWQKYDPNETITRYHAAYPQDDEPLDVNSLTLYPLNTNNLRGAKAAASRARSQYKNPTLRALKRILLVKIDETGKRKAIALRSWDDHLGRAKWSDLF